MRNLSIDALRAFVTTTDLGSVTTAADHLGRSQPAISLQIKKLEEVLDTELFIRLNKKLKLSKAGTQAYDLAKEMLSLNDQLVAQLAKTELAGQIKLGIPSEFATTLLPKIVGRFASAYPNVALEVFSDLSRNLMSENQREQYDLILALHEKPAVKRKGLVRSDELVWVGSSKYRFDQYQTVHLVLAQDGCIYRKRALQALEKVKRQCRIVHTNPDLNGIKMAIQEGLGITVLAKSTVPEGLVILGKDRKENLPSLGAIDISLQYDKRSASDATKRLAGFIQSSF